DYSAVGQTTHLAARMEQLATPGTIRLTATTLRLVEGLVQVQALGLFPVKGLPEPVEVFELVGASTIRRRLQATAVRGLTRFVDGSPNWRRSSRRWRTLARAMGRSWPWWGKRAWASPAWSMSLGMPITPRAGACWRAPRCLTARRPRISQSLTYCGAIA